ncbi:MULTISPECIES: hypothetical protein [Isoptericola]|uniref:hypothetical protein n=1 Tax=Isoptericola TaxID=254250 RepID=UPI0013FDEFA7|nr:MULTISPECIES: hypothetical protein [Isoptericola]
MRRNGARTRTNGRRLAAVTAGCTALLLTGCAGADDPGAGEASASASADTAPAVESSCGGGVSVEWLGTPESEDIYTAVTVVRVSGDGGTAVQSEWSRGEDAGARAEGGATEDQEAMVRDAVAGGLLEATGAPAIVETDSLLVDVDKGTYVLYAYAERTTGSATVSCGDGSNAVDADVTSFEEVETGVADCSTSPDPVTEYVAADAITDYCGRA